MPNVSPPEPPVDLTEAQKAAWADVVSRLPSGWWRGSFPDGLVKQLVRHMAYADLASELEQAIESGERLRLTTQINRQTQLICSLTTKLRLAPSSKFRADHAGAEAVMPPTLRPWENWGSRSKS